MRLIDGLTYTQDGPRGRYLYNWVPNNYKDFVDTAAMMMQAIGIDRLHIAVIYYATEDYVKTNFRPAAFLSEFRGYMHMDLVDYMDRRWDPLSKVYYHYRDYSIQEEQIITEIHPDVVDLVKKILYTKGNDLGLVVLSSFPFLQRRADFIDKDRMAKVVICDLKQIFRNSGEPDLKNAAVLADFSE